MRDLDRRHFMAGAALAGAATASTVWAKTDPDIAEIARTCQPLTGLDFTGTEQNQMLGALDDMVDRAREVAALRFDNALPPAELFDPRLPGWTLREMSGESAHGADVAPLPSTVDDIAFAPARQLSGWIKARRISVRALTQIYLDRIAARAQRLECIAMLMAQSALADADRLDRELAEGQWRGPLHGLPYGLKDLIDTAHVRTAWGAAPYRERVPQTDATIVARLRDAGAVLIAKTTCGAIAYGDIWYGGRTRNPWNIAEGSSGSSAGSAAAVADGLCAFAIGTETMGSIISPSARCGTTGLRPTFGRVPRTGAMALCWSYDKIGVIGRDAGDMAVVLAVLNGIDGLDPCAIDQPLSSAPDIEPKAIRLGYRPGWFEQGLETDRAALEAARRAGFRLVEVDMPAVDLALLSGLVVTEAAAAFQELTASGKDDLLAWQDDIAWPNSWRAAQFETAVGYIQAQRLRSRLMHEFAETFEGVDAILHPNDAAGLLQIGNHCGYPALVLPSGFLDQPTRAGFTAYVPSGELSVEAVMHRVPFTVTLTGRLFEEPLLIAIGARLQSEIGLPDERPKDWAS